jgi:carboxymethylenebutenolidase
MTGSTVEIAAPDGLCNAYLARPDDERNPGVLLIMDAYGLRPVIEQMAGRIASDGYVVLAPNVFYRAGRSPVPTPPDDPEQRSRFFKQTIRPLVEELTPARLAADGAAYLDCLDRVGAPGAVGITGYCMGGRAGWRMAVAHQDRVAALAAFHTGGLVTDDPDSAHLSAGDLKAELYFGFADDDPSMTAEQIAELERTLDKADARYRSEVYQGAKHGYTMADLPVYDEAASERHFSELRALLKRTIG